MNTGIQDAIALAAILTDALNGEANDEHLDAYEALHRPVVVDVVTMPTGTTAQPPCVTRSSARA